MVALLPLLAVTTSSCGYALAGRGSFLPADINTIAIPQLENSTAFFQVEEVLTEKVRSEFIGRGTYAVVPNIEGGDAVLTGQVVAITVQPVGFTEQQLASRYLFTLLMRVEFTDSRTDEVLWSNNSLTFREEYELTTRSATNVEAASFLDQERSSFDRIATDIARTVVTAILEAF